MTQEDNTAQGQAEPVARVEHRFRRRNSVTLVWGEWGEWAVFGGSPVMLQALQEFVAEPDSPWQLESRPAASQPAPAAMPAVELPPLPAPTWHSGTYESARFSYFTESDLRAYGQQCWDAALASRANGLPPTEREVEVVKLVGAFAVAFKYGQDDKCDELMARIRAALATAPSAAERTVCLYAKEIGLPDHACRLGCDYDAEEIAARATPSAVPEAAGALREALRRIGELDENARREESAAVLAQAGDIARAALASAAVPHTEAGQKLSPAEVDALLARPDLASILELARKFRPAFAAAENIFPGSAHISDEALSEMARKAGADYQLFGHSESTVGGLGFEDEGEFMEPKYPSLRRFLELVWRLAYARQRPDSLARSKEAT